MSFNTLERSSPSLFNQGASGLTQLVFYCVFSLFLMLADTRLQISKPIRATVAAVLYPVQRVLLLPVDATLFLAQYVSSLDKAIAKTEVADKKLLIQAQRSGLVEQLQQENDRLRGLLELKPSLKTEARAAEVLYDASDPFSHKVIINLGMLANIEPGSPVIDKDGVLGQVTQVYPLSSEVTLLTDRESSIPVLNVRTGGRSLAFGDPNIAGGAIELRFMAANADVQAGDLLTTSGIDGVYPAGVAVAKVAKVERRPESSFAKIICLPVAQTEGARHVLVLNPLFSSQATPVPPRPKPEAPPETPPVAKKAGVKP